MKFLNNKKEYLEYVTNQRTQTEDLVNKGIQKITRDLGYPVSIIEEIFQQAWLVSN